MWTWYCEPSAGAVAMFAPLEPSRFSAPQLTPESGSPVPALPASAPVPYGRTRLSSLAGPVPAAPAAIWIQISNECVVALPKFLTFCQSTTIQVIGAVGERPDADAAAARRGRVEVGPERSQHVVRPGRVREVLRREHDVRARAAADHEVAVRDDADPRVRLAAVEERRHVEVRDRVVTDARDRRDAEERQRQVAAGRARRPA